jgi:hypothetical protein
MAPLAEDGFIDHYITGVWYPDRDANLVLGLVLVVVLTSWVLFARSVRRRSAAESAGAGSDRAHATR